jgi:hypothetical protein
MKSKDFISISTQTDFHKRCETTALALDSGFAQYTNVDEFSDNLNEGKEPLFIFLSAEDVKKETEVAGRVQVARQLAPSAFILVIISSKLSQNAAAFVKKSGANAVLMESEVMSTSKLEFIASQKIKSSYFPIKSDEIREQTQLNFTVLHVMPLNRKFISVFNQGDWVTGEKAKKLKTINEVYIKREEIEAYRDYLLKFDDKSAAALGRRCRAQFLTLYSSFVDLVLLISDQSEAGSFKLGSELYQKCSNLASELLTTLSATGNAWAIINNSAIGEASSLQRAPAWAAYSGLLSLQSGIGQPVDVMVACLFCDLGTLELSPKLGALTQELRVDERAFLKWHPEDQNEYFSHPIKSLNLALSRKLPIPELIKSIILSSHERIDQKGFPHQILPEKIPMESMILQISEILDKRSQIQMGRENKPIQLVKKQIYEEHLKDSGQLSRLFLEKIRGSLMDI